MDVRYSVRIALSAWLFSACFVQPTHATGGLLDDFVETSSEKIATIVPTLPAAYPGARFLISGFSSPWGNWQFVRVENTSSCEDEACPTIIIHERVQWKVLVLARRQIAVTIGTSDKARVICTFYSKGNAKVVVRYSDDDKILSIAQ
jgi:hypothetical protein